MSAPNILTFRRTIDAVIERLIELRADVEDVHDLAYNRHRAGQTIKVKGGDHGYALDNHGDMEARKLYIAAATTTVALARGVEKALKALRRHLNRDGAAGRRDTSADATNLEVVHALDARKRRNQRGEYTPNPLVVQQVKIPASMIEAQTELDLLRSAIRKVTGPFLAEHQHCRPPIEAVPTGAHDKYSRATKLKRRFQTKLLTPREREAWQRATQSVSVDDKEKAS